MIKEDLEKILGFGVEATENPDFGDYSSNIALQFKTQKSKIKITTQNLNSRQIAEEIVEKLKNNKELNNLVDRIEIAGPGFINFWLKKDILLSNLIQIASDKGKYGMTDSGKGKLAIVEYSSPNIAKPFGVGHLRSTVIGDVIASLLEATGYRVMRDNHLGDWGTQFGKMIYAIKTWGDENLIEKSDKPVAELTKLYIKFHEESEKDESLEDAARAWFKKLEDGDPEARRIWQECVDWSWIEFNKVYELLGIKFNKDFDNGRGLGESFFETRMKSVIDGLNAKKLLKVGEDGAKLVFFEKDKYPPAMILKKDGATLYHTRDLATDKYRLEKYNPDLIINEVGSEQSLYFQQLFEIEKLLGWFKEGARVHVGHGMYLMDGKKMSTRAGKTIELDTVLTEAVGRAKKLQKEDKPPDSAEASARQVGIGAIKYFDLLHQPMTNINFDWDSMFALEGNSGPYLQYTVARTNSVLAKIQNKQIEHSVISKSANKLKIEELAVLRTLIRFPEVISASAASYSPNLLCNYLYDLAQKYNGFYNKDKIIGGENEEFRLALTAATGQVLKNGLKILGISTPEKM
jgi:arginyl-tRNA synthetase